MKKYRISVKDFGEFSLKALDLEILYNSKCRPIPNAHECWPVIIFSFKLRISNCKDNGVCQVTFPNAHECLLGYHTDKKENQIFLIYKEIQSGAVAKSYMRKSFLMYDEMRKYFTIYEEAVRHLWLWNCCILNFLTCEENFLFISADFSLNNKVFQRRRR